MNILLLYPYPKDTAPSQRFRFEQYIAILKEKGYQINEQSFLDTKTWKILYKKKHHFQKIKGIIKGFLRRIKIVFFLKKYDFIFIHREATPLGLPFIEWIIAKIWRKKIIFDFDDAIWLANTSQENKLVAQLKFHQKTNWICKWAFKVSVGNNYLKEYAQQFNQNVILNPTTIDTEKMHNPSLFSSYDKEIFTIGWTGTHSTLPYLDFLWEILEELEKKYTFRFLVIANQKPTYPLKSLYFLEWKKETEIQDLMKMDIGVMPLTDDKWAKGKCGFKALQYMSLNIPTIASPVGVNTEIIQHNKNGFLCSTAEEWQKTLEMILENPKNFQNIGENARNTIINYYSVLSNTENFKNLFK
jgi:glycosyltransferase involved in cell wall biosynthesis